ERAHRLLPDLAGVRPCADRDDDAGHPRVPAPGELPGASVHGTRHDAEVVRRRHRGHLLLPDGELLLRLPPRRLEARHERVGLARRVHPRLLDGVDQDRLDRVDNSRDAGLAWIAATVEPWGGRWRDDARRCGEAAGSERLWSRDGPRQADAPELVPARL